MANSIMEHIATIKFMASNREKFFITQFLNLSKVLNFLAKKTEHALL